VSGLGTKTEMKQTGAMARAVVAKLVELANKKGKVTISKDFGHSMSCTLSTYDTHTHPGWTDQSYGKTELDFLKALMQGLETLENHKED
jgi:hypothetical protein